MECPKCRGRMRTFDRNGVHIEQCDNCRGIFLDYGELETLTRMEAQWAQQSYAPPPPHGGPAWGAHHGGHHGHHRHRSWVEALFSS
ncbi:zf-TFIIB domain-containing protein [Microbispora sp. RL4-1S]|uniref:Zf-TFIIB domain-containing protein n=1 Tax=Microbispora oryzae TaxID=2806554 RepID=A0A940WMA4_9ACTN|nr:zf-TFIIB domain-containing protein [Microbispora oryzae]MBP2704070.1 zf-TFIIB domain-containing protein [Microbispora oryzae]